MHLIFRADQLHHPSIFVYCILVIVCCMDIYLLKSFCAREDTVEKMAKLEIPWLPLWPD